jgi:hypothetical protein
MLIEIVPLDPDVPRALIAWLGSTWRYARWALIGWVSPHQMVRSRAQAEVASADAGWWPRRDGSRGRRSTWCPTVGVARSSMAPICPCRPSAPARRITRVGRGPSPGGERAAGWLVRALRSDDLRDPAEWQARHVAGRSTSPCTCSATGAKAATATSAPAGGRMLTFTDDAFKAAIQQEADIKPAPQHYGRRGPQAAGSASAPGASLGRTSGSATRGSSALCSRSGIEPPLTCSGAVSLRCAISGTLRRPWPPGSQSVSPRCVDIFVCLESVASGGGGRWGWRVWSWWAWSWRL